MILMEIFPISQQVAKYEADISSLLLNGVFQMSLYLSRAPRYSTVRSRLGADKRR